MRSNFFSVPPPELSSWSLHYKLFLAIDKRGVVSKLMIGHCRSSGQERHNVSQLDPAQWLGPRPSGKGRGH
jgi:hypothetical protein